VIHTFTSDEKGGGVALLNNELFVLRDRADNQIDVYSTINFTLLRQHHVSIDNLVNVCDMTACRQKRCVYLLNGNESGVHRLALDGTECKWPLNADTPLCLSVTQTSEVLVLCSFITEDKTEVNKLLFLNSENGECVRMITAQVRVDVRPYQCVELKEDRYLLTYHDGDEVDDPGGIGLLDGEGKLLQSTEDEVVMHHPGYLAVDSDQFVFVCNIGASSVDLFDPMLGFVCNLTEGIALRPRSFVLDEFTRRLYIDEYFHKVSVVQL